MITVKDYSPQYEMGLQWFTVGEKLKYIDDGIGSDHYKTIVTFTGDYTELMAMYINFVDSDGTYTFARSDRPFFGPQYLYTSPIIGKLYDIKPPELLFRDVATMQVTIGATMEGFVSPISFALSNFCIDSISRSIKTGFDVGEVEYGDYVIDTQSQISTCSINLLGHRDVVAATLSNIQQSIRGNDVSVVTADTWLFDPYRKSNTCKIISLGNLKPYDMAENWWSFTIELGDQT